jgi:hypothetical protein
MDAHAPKKNNTLNTIGIITVGVVGSVFVYVAIIGLQALYVSETSAIATVKSFGAQGEVKASLRAEQIGNITEPRTRAPFGPDNTPLYAIGIDAAKALIIRDAGDPSRFVPAVAPSVKATIAPAFGRPQPLPPPPPPPDPTAPPVDGAADPGAAGGTVPAGSGLPDGPAGAPPSGEPAPTTPPAAGATAAGGPR